MDMKTVEYALMRYGGKWDWLTDEQVRNYAESLIAHIRYVRDAGARLKVPYAQLDMHDWSKWTEREFPYYARNFFGGESPIDAERIPDDFAAAWLHHIHCGEHHWQHWIFSDGFTPKNSTVEAGVVPMPYNYMLEMVADWQGASRGYTGSEDMIVWLDNNMPRIRVHSKTAADLRDLLNALGYADVVYGQRFAQEVSA